MQRLKFHFALCLFVIVVFVVCLVCCRDADVPTIENQDSFYAKVVARNCSAYVWWHCPDKCLEQDKISSINIFYDEYNDSSLETSKIDDDSLQELYECDSTDNKYLINGLSNNIKYIVRVCGFNEQDDETYREDFIVTPGSFTAKFENATAVIFDNKIYFSWAFSEIDKEQFKTVNIYAREKGVGINISEVSSTIAFEEIINESDNINDTCPRYDEYYSCVSSDKKFAVNMTTFVLKAVNQEGVETDESVTVRAYESDIPVVMLDMDLESNYDKFVSQKKIPATLSVTNDFDGNDIEDVEITIKGRGNSSWRSSPKKSYTIKFSKKLPFLGMNKAKSFALIANYFDKTQMRNAYAYSMVKELFTNQTWAPNYEFVDLFINGVYQGLYLCVEAPKINDERINIPNLENCVNVSDFDNYGWLLEANVRADESFNFTTEHNLVFSLKDPDAEDLSSEIKECIKAKIQTIENALYSEDYKDTTSANYWKNYLDEKSLVDWVLLEECAKNPDSNMYSSCYVYFDPSDQKLHFGPVWDFDLGFGNIRGVTAGDWKTKASWRYDGVLVNNNWFNRLWQSDEFNNMVKLRYEELHEPLVQYFPNYKNNLFDNLESSIKINITRWSILGKETYKCPEGYEQRVTYSDEIDYLSEWLSNRFSWIDENL